MCKSVHAQHELPQREIHPHRFLLCKLHAQHLLPHTYTRTEGGRERERERERDRERDRLLPCKHHMTVCEEICGVLAIRLCSDDERFQLRQDLSDVLNIVELGEAIADVIRRI